MPSPPRILIPGLPTLITSRVEVGLPFVATRFMNLLFWSAIGRAQSLYPVAVCGLCLMGNHFHMLIVVDEPNDVVDFVDRIKTEIAHSINRLLGRKQRTVWHAGYDATPILTIEDTIEKLAYLYTNPQNANLVESIDSYPGVSTWGMFLGAQLSLAIPWIQRTMVTQKPNKSWISEKEDSAFVDEMKAASRVSHLFRFEPFRWLQSFGINKGKEGEYREKVIAAVRKREQELSARRIRPCIGANRLSAMALNMTFYPKKFAKRVWCICWDVELRKSFIQLIKKLRTEARAVWRQWRSGDFSATYPLGLFPPRRPKIGNLVFRMSDIRA